MTGKQLKNSILQWAIQGKLVPQDPNDEPASELLKRIREEKARLVKEGKIKKDKNESIIFRGDDNSYYEKFPNGEKRCIDDEIPFEIPLGWEWVRWGNLSNSIQYGYNAPAKETGRIKMVRISDIQNGRIVWETTPFCNIEEKEIANYLLKKNDILFARTGGTVGKSYLVSEEPEEAIYAGYLIRTRYSSLLCARYLKTFMESSLYWAQLKDGTIATAQPNCNGQTLSKMILPLPPLAEQHRIVAKIEELMPLVEKYGAAQEALDEWNKALPEKLKKSILQEAIQGKLVPQDPADEPASVLLERIRLEKLRLVKEGKLKKKDVEGSAIFRGDDNKYYEQIGNKCIDISDEIPFSIPDNWEWCRLKQLCKITMGQSPDGESINRVSGLEFHQGKIQFGKIFLNVSDTYTNKPTKIAEANSLLLCVRAPVGTLNITKRQICIGRGLCSISFYYNGNVLLLFYFLSTYKQYFEKKATGSTFKAISNDIISETLVPLPPLEEQTRIVDRIEELFSKL